MGGIERGGEKEREEREGEQEPGREGEREGEKEIERGSEKERGRKKEENVNETVTIQRYYTCGRGRQLECRGSFSIYPSSKYKIKR